MCEKQISNQKYENLVNENNKIVETVLREIQHALDFCEWYKEVDEPDKHLMCFSDDKEINFLIFSTYALMENSIKNIFENSLEAISGNYSLRELTEEIVSLFYREKLLSIKEEISNLNNKYFEREIGRNERGSETIKKLVRINADLYDTKFESNGNMIQTNSNLSFDNFMSIAVLFFSAEQLKKYRAEYKFTLNTIVHYRNNIAHGNVKNLNNVPSHIRKLDNKSAVEEVEKIGLFILEVHYDIVQYMEKGLYLN